MGSGAKAALAAIIVGGTLRGGDFATCRTLRQAMAVRRRGMQTMEMVGTLAAAVILAPVLTLLFKAYGFAGHSSAKANGLSAAPEPDVFGVQRRIRGPVIWSLVIIRQW
jgi:hypothetical protein